MSFDNSDQLVLAVAESFGTGNSSNFTIAPIMVVAGTTDGNASFVTTSPLTDGSLQPDERIGELKKVSYSIILPIVCVLGIVGNLLNLCVLRRAKFQGATMYTFLRWMTFSDTVSLAGALSSVAPLSDQYFITNEVSAIYYAHLLLWFLNTFLSSSALFVVWITVERYLSVCHPIKGKAFITAQRARIIVAASYLLPAIFYLPFAFQYQYKEMFKHINATHQGNASYYAIGWNPGLQTDWYTKGYKWAREATLKFLPVLIVVLLNVWTLLELKVIMQRRRQMLNKKSSGNSASTVSDVGGKVSAPVKTAKQRRAAQEQRNLNIMLICVVVVYIICLTPIAIHLAVQSPELELIFEYVIFEQFANIAELVNSALNFYTYAMASRQFREELQCLLSFIIDSRFCRCCRENKRRISKRLRSGSEATAGIAEGSTAVSGGDLCAEEEYDDEEEEKEQGNQQAAIRLIVREGNGKVVTGPNTDGVLESARLLENREASTERQTETMNM